VWLWTVRVTSAHVINRFGSGEREFALQVESAFGRVLESPETGLQVGLSTIVGSAAAPDHGRRDGE
jgi:hypothetical protein